MQIEFCRTKIMKECNKKMLTNKIILRAKAEHIKFLIDNVIGDYDIVRLCNV